MLRIRDVYPGSRILIFSHPGSRTRDLGSRISDPKTATKERDEKKLVVIPFYVATNFTKFKIILVLNAEEKILASFQRIMELFTPKIFTELSKYRFGIRDPGSEIRDPQHWIQR